MPIYEYVCEVCGERTEELLPVRDRAVPGPCRCGGWRRLTPSKVHLDLLEPYFDEGLGCDIESAGHRRKVLRERGLIEAGDRVGGSRNFDEKAPEHVGKLPLKGISSARAVGRDQPILVKDEKGKVVESTTWNSLEAI